MIGPLFPTVLRTAQDGDERAVGELFAAYDPALRRYLEGRASGSGDDIAQEVWIAAARNLRTFEGDEGAFRAWLFSIARSKVVDHRRKAARRPSTPVDPSELASRAGSQPPTDTLAVLDAIAELVDGLTEEQTDIVLLRVVGGFSVDEVANLLGKRAGTVRVAQHRALRKLAGKMASGTVTP